MAVRLILFLMLCVMGASHAVAREQIRIVGSSTVFPFVATASERFSEKTGMRAPIVESIGTGAGFVEFCKGTGVDYPDMVNASRPIKSSEQKRCKSNGVKQVIEVPIGKDGVVIASSLDTPALSLTLKDIFLALAAKVPVDGALNDNPYQTWRDIRPELPDQPIVVYGPASTSGTRDAFVELAMEPYCSELPEFIAAYAEKKARGKACHMIREDGAYIEAGENDNLIVQKLVLNKNALGIFGYSYLEQNSDKIQAHHVEGIAPEYETIADGSYPIARSLFVYTKASHLRAIEGLRAFLDELTSDAAVSDEGYLAYKGLIPVPDAQRREARALLELP